MRTGRMRAEGRVGGVLLGVVLGVGVTPAADAEDDDDEDDDANRCAEEGDVARRVVGGRGEEEGEEATLALPSTTLAVLGRVEVVMVLRRSHSPHS